MPMSIDRPNRSGCPDDSLPSFERPPVIETVLGVQFEPLSAFTNGHLGAFWKRLGRDWVHLSDAAAIEPQFEHFGVGQSWGGIRLSLAPPGVRLRLMNRAKDRMIQVQNGRLHYNWIGHGKDYPRYRLIRPEFDKTFQAFEDFVSEEALGEVLPNQWEVTYVNRIPSGTLWSAPADWGTRVIPGLLGSLQGTTDVSMERFGGQWHFEIQPYQGRLHVEISQRVSEPEDEPDVLILKLTARGPIARNEAKGLSLAGGLDLGRRVIVESFKSLTAKEAHEHWGIRQ
jgi:uncharacterized protein (TIGR04255 family)